MKQTRLYRKQRAHRRRYKPHHTRRKKQRGGDTPFITIYIMCFNEEVMLPKTVNYYKRQFPSHKIVVCDNESTDSSVKLAKSLGCEIFSFSTGGEFNEEVLTRVRNTVWKEATSEWVMVVDMDELVCITEADVRREQTAGSTVFRTEGYDIIGESKKADASDIDILDISKGIRTTTYDKCVCFNRARIQEMNFSLGSHTCSPTGDVSMTKNAYRLYHFKFLGEPYYLQLVKGYLIRRKNSYEFQGVPVQGINDDKIAGKYREQLSKAIEIPPLRLCKQ
jgi:glycosyltransferase involved in cell wall biosynthesis